MHWVKLGSLKEDKQTNKQSLTNKQENEKENNTYKTYMEKTKQKKKRPWKCNRGKQKWPCFNHKSIFPSCVACVLIFELEDHVISNRWLLVTLIILDNSWQPLANLGKCWQARLKQSTGLSSDRWDLRLFAVGRFVVSFGTDRGKLERISRTELILCYRYLQVEDNIGWTQLFGKPAFLVIEESETKKMLTWRDILFRLLEG